MNRLGFADFHNKHFSPDQKAYWQNMLQQQQQQQYDQHQSIHNNYYQEQPAQMDYVDTKNYEFEEEGIEEEEVVSGLTKEAIEIFKFSEAYRKERELERLKEEQVDLGGMEDWQFDESTVHVSGGQEAPATSLVLINKSNKSKISGKIRTQEDLLNSAYLSSCCDHNQDTSVVLWPVLPFKM